MDKIFFGILFVGFAGLMILGNSGPGKDISFTEEEYTISTEETHFEFALGERKSLNTILTGSKKRKDVFSGGGNRTVWLTDSDKANLIKMVFSGRSQCEESAVKKHSQEFHLLPANKDIAKKLASFPSYRVRNMNSWRKVRLDGYCVDYTKEVLYQNRLAMPSKDFYANCGAFVVDYIWFGTRGET